MQAGFTPQMNFDASSLLCLPKGINRLPPIPFTPPPTHMHGWGLHCLQETDSTSSYGLRKRRFSSLTVSAHTGPHTCTSCKYIITVSLVQKRLRRGGRARLCLSHQDAEISCRGSSCRWSLMFHTVRGFTPTGRTKNKEELQSVPFIYSRMLMRHQSVVRFEKTIASPPPPPPPSAGREKELLHTTANSPPP